jgi:hypothetical protein
VDAKAFLLIIANMLFHPKQETAPGEKTSSNQFAYLLPTQYLVKKHLKPEFLI